MYGWDYLHSSPTCPEINDSRLHSLALLYLSSSVIPCIHTQFRCMRLYTTCNCETERDRKWAEEMSSLMTHFWFLSVCFLREKEEGSYLCLCACGSHSLETSYLHTQCQIALLNKWLDSHSATPNSFPVWAWYISNSSSHLGEKQKLYFNVTQKYPK